VLIFLSEYVILFYFANKIEDRSMKEKIHNKLARDKIPHLLAAKDIECIVSKLSGEQYRNALEKKLYEEVLEFITASDMAHQVEELADILEVIHAISSNLKINFSDIEKVRQDKFLEKGGFYEATFLEKTIDRHQAFETISPCVFCQIAQLEKPAEIISKFKHCYVMKDQYPVTEGHLLIIPFEHTLNWFTASDEIRHDINKALIYSKAYLDSKYKPDGYNVGLNCGDKAGQTVMHLHMHLIPRYDGDMHDPKGGVRGVIPAKQKY